MTAGPSRGNRLPALVRRLAWDEGRPARGAGERRENAVTEPEEEQEKTRKTDRVLFSPDGDPHHTLAEAPQPDEHLPPTVTRDGHTDVLDDEQ